MKIRQFEAVVVAELKAGMTGGDVEAYHRDPENKSKVSAGTNVVVKFSGQAFEPPMSEAGTMQQVSYLVMCAVFDTDVGDLYDRIDEIKSILTGLVLKDHIETSDGGKDVWFSPAFITRIEPQDEKQGWYRYDIFVAFPTVEQQETM